VKSYSRLLRRPPGAGPYEVRVRSGVYDPGTANQWKFLVAVAGSKVRPSKPIQGPIELRVAFFMPRPKSKSRRKDPSGPMWHLGKPDSENLTKAVMDCLTQDGWWRDDSQVCLVTTRKLYHAKDGVPGASITVLEAPDLAEKASVALCRGFEEKTTSEASREKSPHSEAERP
jgi:Holliday junction resolvase RusA-like endonuclease